MQKKIFINFLIVLVISLAIIGFFTVRMTERMYLTDVEQRLKSQAYLLGEMLSEYDIEANDQKVQTFIKELSKNIHERITVVDKYGNVLGDTNFDPAKMENHLQRPEIKQAINGSVGMETRYSTTLKVDFLYVAQPVYKDEAVVGVVRLSTSLQEISAIMRDINQHMFLALIPGLLLSLILGYRIAINITRPIKEIKDAAIHISQGKLDTELNITSHDEIGQLAKSIDLMAVTLKDKISSIKEKNTNMEAILSSVVNGIIAVDSNQNILFINPIAYQLLNIEENNIVGKHLLEAIRNNKIDDLIRGILQDSNFADTEIHINYPTDKILKLYTNPIRYPESEEIIGIIISIQDVTEIRKLENVRSEFVANVSHEIKTPLTSIKGFVETLKAGALEDSDTAVRFLNIIEDEADRLNRLITDILSLSELENKKIKIRKETIQPADKIKEIVSILQSHADKKNIHLITSLQDNMDNMFGDPDQFKQMLINLVDNAIKYTPENGIVEVKARNINQNLMIGVKDNGIGIPKEHIPRLFERFYRVDRARSRNVGGTGLGLAIVKHIVLQFEGTIEVKSEVGKGTEFIVTLPIRSAAKD